MRSRRRILSYVLAQVLALSVIVLGSATPAIAATVSINEIRIDQPSIDTDEYFELAGAPGDSLTGLTYIVIGDGSGGSGTIEAVIDLTGETIPGSGYFVAAESSFSLGTADLTTNLNFENSDNVTHLLVAGFSGASGDDVDTDNDGVIDSPAPWTSIVDSVALVETPSSGDLIYSTTTVGPDGPFVPGHVYYCTDGWRIGNFTPGGLDTPGSENPCVKPDVTASIYDIQFTTDAGGDSPLEGVTVVTEGVVTARFGNRLFIQDGAGPWSGLFLFSPTATPPVGTEIVVSGVVSEFFGLTQIASGVVFVVGSADVPQPALLASGDIGDEQWESVFVAAIDVTVTDDSLGFGEWRIDDGTGGVRVDDLGSYGYSPTNGDALLLVQGPLNYSFGNFKIEPRNDGDIGSLVLTISEIQGPGQFSPHQGQLVATKGIVTATDRFGGRDIWFQDGGDGDSATSDGILGNDFGDLADLNPGDLIYVIADVQEQQFGSALPRTRLDDATAVIVVSSGNPLPAAVVLSDLPSREIIDGADFWEPLEGMLVTVQNAIVTSATNGFGEFGMLTAKDAKPGSGFFKKTSQIIVKDLGGGHVDYNPERIIVDDTTMSAIDVRPGDTVESLTGVVDYTFSMYKLQPTAISVNTAPIPSGPVSSLPGKTKSGDLTVATFNVENLFDLVDEPGKDDIGTGGAATQADLDLHLAKLALAIEDELRLPSIIVAQEVENQAILQVLGDLVNTSAGTDYIATSFETSDGRGIEVGFLWDANRVSLTDAFGFTEGAQPGTDAAFGASSPSPGREPIVGSFDVGGELLTIVGVHLKSKRGDDPLYGVNWPPIRVSEVQRKAQASVIRDFLDTLPGGDNVMVTGDFNDFAFEEPGEGAAHPLAIIAGSDMTNLVMQIPAADRFTFVFDGNSQVLDHMLVSSSLLAELSAVRIMHFNTPFPASLEDDVTTALVSSDHDPILARFGL